MAVAESFASEHEPAAFPGPVPEEDTGRAETPTHDPTTNGTPAEHDEPSLAGVDSVPVPAAPVALPVASVLAPGQESTAVLEDRIRRLEEALARISQAPTAAPATGGGIQCDPPAPGSPPRTSILAHIGRRVLSAASAPSGPVPPEHPKPETGKRRPWLLTETVAEARAIFRMFFDPRYRLSWSGRFVPLILVAMIVTSWWWVPGTSIPVLGTILNKAMDLALAYVLFKVLGREARRYRETAPDLPASLRL